jgi:radical SAM superfamily enzyme YgiQ (UPF0313 family)
MYIASCLRNEKHTIKIIDVAKTRQKNESTIAELREFHPDLIGVSGIITAYKFIHVLVRDIKRDLPNIPVVVGGHITLDNTDLLLKSVGCDYAIIGYGEKKIAYLIEYLEGKRNISTIPGLAYLNDGGTQIYEGNLFFKNIDEIPFPAYDLIDMEYYITVTKTIPPLEEYLQKTGKMAPPMRSFFVIGARGCTDQCSFCVHEFDHGGFHPHSIDYVMNNIQILYEKYGVRIFGFGEDLFLYKPKQAKQLVEEMNKRFPDAFFSCSTRADYVTPELISVLEDSNCYLLLYGFESGSEPILQVLGKRMKPETNINAFKLIRATKIIPQCSFMVGSPGETRKTIRDTIEAINAAGIGNGGVFFTTPYPGSRLFRWCVEQGRIKDIEAYLFTISDRDANVLSFNFTPFPDIIVRIMYILLQNTFQKNQKAIDKHYRISFKDLSIKHYAFPTVYEMYFFLRKCLSRISSKYKTDTIEFERNSHGSVRLSCDQ